MSLNTKFETALSLSDSQPPNWMDLVYPPPATITTDRLLIRRYHINDAEQLAQLANDAAVAATLNDRFPHPYALQDARDWITGSQTADKHGVLPARFGIFKRDESEYQGQQPQVLLGGIGLEAETGKYARNAELGYWLGSAHWGNGYATEATHAMLSWGFGPEWPGKEPLLRIWARVIAGNAGSERVLIRCGFVQEALKKQAVWKDGVAKDELYMAMTRKRWEVSDCGECEEEMESEESESEESESEGEISLGSDHDSDDDEMEMH